MVLGFRTISLGLQSDRDFSPRGCRLSLCRLAQALLKVDCHNVNTPTEFMPHTESDRL
jgi:hypothetical protein